MKHCLVAILACTALACSGSGVTAGEGENPMVLMSTSKGDIKIELYEDKAPITVKNFLSYVRAANDGTIFHRVIPRFMIQGGGFDAEMNQKESKKPIKNEATNGLRNDTGTLAMARTNEVDSATAQFFINVKDNDFLNHKSESPREFGYAVFGGVVEGMDVVHEIERVQTKNRRGHGDVPVEPVIIESVKVLGK